MTWILIAITVSVCQLSLGFVLGLRARKPPVQLPVQPPVQPPAQSPAGPESEEQAAKDQKGLEQQHEQLSGLRDLATSLAEDVALHTTRVEHATRNLDDLPQRDSTAAGVAITASAAEILRANQQLQEQLTAAHMQLELQSKEIDARLAESRTDSLTGLANRRALDSELSRRCSEVWRRHTNLSVMMLDVDEFKKLNDSHGHDAGDYVLKQVAHKMTETARAMDLVARYGGEEFCVVLPSTTLEQAKVAAERMRIAIAGGRFTFEGKEIQVTASVGVAAVKGGDDAASITRRADEALYASKRGGRNCGHFHNGESCERIVLELEKEGVRKADDQTSSETVAQEARRAHERRTAPRRPFDRRQSIAPYAGGAVPSASLFYEVACHDISATGFSFLAAAPPTFGRLVVALGVAPNLTYMAAEVVNQIPMSSDAGCAYRVGCRFMERVA